MKTLQQLSDRKLKRLYAQFTLRWKFALQLPGELPRIDAIERKIAEEIIIRELKDMP